MAGTVDEWHGLARVFVTGRRAVARVVRHTMVRSRASGGGVTPMPLCGSTLLQLCSAVVLDQVSFVLVPLLAAREEQGVAYWPGRCLLESLVVRAGNAVPLRCGAISRTAHDSGVSTPTVLLGGTDENSIVGAAWGRLLHGPCPLCIGSGTSFSGQWRSAGVFFTWLGGVGHPGLPTQGVRLAAWVQVLLWCRPALLLVGDWEPGRLDGRPSCGVS